MKQDATPISRPSRRSLARELRDTENGGEKEVRARSERKRFRSVESSEALMSRAKSPRLAAKIHSLTEPNTSSSRESPRIRMIKDRLESKTTNLKAKSPRLARVEDVNDSNHSARERIRSGSNTKLGPRVRKINKKVAIESDTDDGLHTSSSPLDKIKAKISQRTLGNERLFESDTNDSAQSVEESDGSNHVRNRIRSKSRESTRILLNGQKNTNNNKSNTNSLPAKCVEKRSSIVTGSPRILVARRTLRESPRIGVTGDGSPRKGKSDINGSKQTVEKRKDENDNCEPDDDEVRIRKKSPRKVLITPKKKNSDKCYSDDVIKSTPCSVLITPLKQSSSECASPCRNSPRLAGKQKKKPTPGKSYLRERSDEALCNVENSSSSDENPLTVKTFYGNGTPINAYGTAKFRKKLLEERSLDKVKSEEHCWPLEGEKSQKKNGHMVKKAVSQVSNKIKGRKAVNKRPQAKPSVTTTAKTYSLALDRSNVESGSGDSKPFPKKRFFTNRSPGKHMRTLIQTKGYVPTSGKKSTDEKKMFADWSKKRKQQKNTVVDKKMADKVETDRTDGEKGVPVTPVLGHTDEHGDSLRDSGVCSSANPSIKSNSQTPGINECVSNSAADDVESGRNSAMSECVSNSDLSNGVESGRTSAVSEADSDDSTGTDLVNLLPCEGLSPGKSRGDNSMENKVQDKENLTADSNDRDEAAVSSSLEAASDIIQQKRRLFAIFSAAASQSSPASNAPSSTASSPSTPHASRRTLRSVNTSPACGSPKQLWRKMRDKDGNDQMMLDFGQKLQVTEPCSVCGVTYTRGEPNDENTHAKVHHRILDALKFAGWKKERVLQEFVDGGRIIMILPDERQFMKKVAAVQAVVDEELGFVVERSVATRPNSKVFLYISERRIVGFCIAEVIAKGYRVLSEDEVHRQVSSPTKRTRPSCCSTEPVAAKCGINRIWVLSGQRKRNVATKLVDCVCNNFLLGRVLGKQQLAFSDPTPDGHRFAARYTHSQHFLVYNKRT